MRRLLILLTVTLIAAGAAAQSHDPAVMAQEQTSRLDRLVGLTPAQYNKIFRFHKRQMRILQNRSHRSTEEMREDLERLQEKTTRKYRRVLTTPQFERWSSFEAERSFRRIYEYPVINL